MIHIVFQEADIDVLNKAIELDESLQGPVEIIRDDYAIGPLQNLYETEGYQQRREWWKAQIEGSPYNTDQLMAMVDDRLTVHTLKRTLEEAPKEVLWIWMGQNAHDVCGYYWLIGQLSVFVGRVFVLYMNNLPFINEKGQIFYPTTLHQILPKEFLKAKKLCRRVTPSEFEVDSDEWKKQMEEDKIVRVLEGGKKITGRSEDFYDADVLAGLTAELQKGARAMQSILSKMKVKTGDIFLLSRIKKLAEEGRLELTGDPSNGWKEFEVRLKRPAAETIEADHQNK